MIFLPETRYLSLDAGQKRSPRSVGAVAAAGARRTRFLRPCTMVPRALLLAVAIVCLQETSARPVRRTLNFNMFVLRPRPDAPDRLLMSTEGVSRFGPILEYLVQRVQGLMSVRVPPKPEFDQSDVPEDPVANREELSVADAAENEVDGIQEARMPGVVVRPSRTKPGTYEVEIDVVVDDGQPGKKETNTTK